MSHESLPSDSSGEPGNEPIQPELNDFDRWEQELASNEHIAEYSEQLGQLAVMNVVASEIDPEILLISQIENIVEPPKEPEKQEAKPQELSYESPEHHSGDNYLLSDDMFQAAMGLIYFTSGVSADEMYK